MASTVILPLDRSEVAEQALPVARELTRRTGSELVLVSVIEAPRHIAEWAASRDPDEVIASWAQQQGEVSDYLDRIAGHFAGMTVATHTLAGNPVRQLVDLAHHVESPVIVMASHGYSTLQQLRLGSVATGVVQSAPCPVIIVRADGHAPRDAFERLLVTLDGSDFAEEALGALQAVLGTSGLNLHLLRVVETAKVVGGVFASFRYSGIEYYIGALHEEATAYLQGIADELSAAGHEVTWEVREGAVADEIEQVAGEQGASMVVMSTHGRSGLEHVLLGSVAERVVRHATRPLFVVRPALAKV